MNLKFIICLLYLLFSTLVTPIVYAKHWTLQSSVAQAMAASPELRQSSAKIGERNADLKLSEMWPDPSISLKVDNQVGLDTGTGDYALSEISISQDIPLSRIKYQKSVAQAQLSVAVHEKSNDSLLLQNRVEKIFYELQLATSIYKLAIQQVKFADKYNEPSLKNNQGRVVRYLTPLEKMRLSIIREKAHQAESAAEGKLQETRTKFYKLLVIEEDEELTVPELVPLEKIPELSELSDRQFNHPVLSAQQKTLQAAMNEIDLARSSAMKDPTVSFNRLRENFSSGTESIYGVMLNIEIPIHDRKNSVVSKASYNASQQRIELGYLKHGLKMNLKRSFMHLKHVTEQAKEYKNKVLAPSTKILALSKQGFASGELNILSLVDANNTYFESNIQYLDLIYQSWDELADINLYSGIFVLDETAKIEDKKLMKNTLHKKIVNNRTAGEK